MSLIILDECPSTNTEAKREALYHHGDIVMAVSQTAGRGQRGRTWDSTPGANLTFSVVVEPTFLKATLQFLLAEATALALSDTLLHYSIRGAIKWTNDIYVGDNKISGTLIENELQGAYLRRSVVGTGLNVNQTRFADWVPNPTSMKRETGLTYDIYEIMEHFERFMWTRYEILKQECVRQQPERADGLPIANGYNTPGQSILQQDYHSLLYRRNSPHTFRIPDEGEVTGTIRRVLPTGGLIVEISGREREFQFKEIEFVI